MLEVVRYTKEPGPGREMRMWAELYRSSRRELPVPPLPRRTGGWAASQDCLLGERAGWCIMCKDYHQQYAISAFESKETGNNDLVSAGTCKDWMNTVKWIAVKLFLIHLLKPLVLNCA